MKQGKTSEPSASIVRIGVRWIDITLPLSPTTVAFPGDQKLSFKSAAVLEKDGMNTTRLLLGSHSGTHMDAPSHFLENGRTIDEIDPERFTGSCRVLDLTQARKEITKAHLENHDLKKGERILLKTRNASCLRRPQFCENFMALSQDCASYLAARNVLTVGIDYLSIEAFGSGKQGYPVHKALLRKEILIIEGLDLFNVSEGTYELYAFPLRLKGLDGSPCRVFLRRS